MRGERGLSLVEATVILAVVSMLSAVLAPSVRNYVQTAQQAAAKKDVEAIGTAVARMLVDTGEAWFLRNAAAGTGTANHHITPSHDNGVGPDNSVDLLVSDGNIPGVVTARSSGAPDWNAAMDSASVQRLDWFLTLNTPSGLTANRYRTATDMSATGGFDPDGAGTFNAEHAWRGSYLPGPLGPDPWGFRYAVNVEYLQRTVGAGPAGAVNDVVVISAGNNGLIETRYDTDGVTAPNDVIFLVSGGTR